MDYTIKINYIAYCNIKESKKRFIDFIDDGCGKFCKMIFDEKTKRYEIKPIENQTK